MTQPDLLPVGTPPDAAVTAYQPDFARQAEHLCRLGAEIGDLAAALGVDEPTIDAWVEAHPLFAQAIARGLAHADGSVTAALFKRATGFELPVVKWLREDGRMVAKTYRRHIPPDTKACMYWLENRRPDLWGRRRTPASQAPHRRDASCAGEDVARHEIRAAGGQTARPANEASCGGDDHAARPAPRAHGMPNAVEAHEASTGGEDHAARQEVHAPGPLNARPVVEASTGSNGHDARQEVRAAGSRLPHKWKRKQKRADARRRRVAVDRVASAPCLPPLALIAAAPPAGRYAQSPPA